MNVGDDIAQLSYKELQALALRYRVPGNIKKKILVKVLQAARSGNEAEFSRLLQELRKNRKRKTKKPKDPKLGITSTPLHSPDYIMADDDYYYQQQQQSQQQPPYQWVGAEEEIVSRDDDNKIPHYEEFKQFLLKRIQRDLTCNANNNNQIQDLSIMNLRTSISPNMQSISLDTPSYSRACLINDTDPLTMNTIDRPSYQVLKEPEGSSQGSVLLKRMLQAPVGANLGEIASSLFWASNLLDNSDTLTADSESNENEDQLEAATNVNEYYALLKQARTNEILLNEANLRNVMTMTTQTSSEDHYRYHGDVDIRPHHYQNWATNVMELPESELQPSKVFHTIYSNTDSAVAANVADNNNLDGNYQYQINTEAACNGNQNFLNFDVNYTAGTDVIPVSDSPDIYHLQNLGKNSEEIGTGYFHNVESLIQNNTQQQPTCYANSQPTYTNGIHSTPDVTYQYLYPRFTQEVDNTLHERLENQQLESIVAGIESGVNQVIGAPSMQGSIGGTVVEPFWPKWTVQTGTNLENLLNYHVPQEVDHAKLGQTSCVYSYMPPIVSHKSILENNACSQTQRYTAEQRQHSFSPYWMLYDTSQGMRMTSTPIDSIEQPATLTHAATVTGNDDLRQEVVYDIETQVNDVWMNHYQQMSIANAQASDSLYCNAVTDRIDDPTSPDITID